LRNHGTSQLKGTILFSNGRIGRTLNNDDPCLRPYRGDVCRDGDACGGDPCDCFTLSLIIFFGGPELPLPFAATRLGVGGGGGE
jgi:hypothetical protein